MHALLYLASPLYGPGPVDVDVPEPVFEAPRPMVRSRKGKR